MMRLLGTITSVLLIFCAGFYAGMHKDAIIGYIEEKKESIKNAGYEPLAGSRRAIGEDIGQLTAKEQSPGSQDRELQIASFYITGFPRTGNDEGALTALAHILKHHDVIALQNMRREETAGRLVHILATMGHNFRYMMSPPVAGAGNRRYAFFFRDDTVIRNGEGAFYPDPAGIFTVIPFYAGFRSGEFDFMLVSVDCDNSTDAKLKGMLKELAKVYAYVQAKDPKEQDVILLGNFNASPDEKGFSSLKAVTGMVQLIKPPSATTIDDENLFDNIWFQTGFLKEYSGIAGVNKFDETIFSNDDARASRQVSRRRLIWAKFKTAGPDDDGASVNSQ